MYITKRSEATGIEHTRDIDIDPEEHWAWLTSGEHIQNYFPGLSSDDREFLLTGVTPEEWDELFGDIEEDEDSDYTGYPLLLDDGDRF